MRTIRFLLKSNAEVTAYYKKVYGRPQVKVHRYKKLGGQPLSDREREEFWDLLYRHCRYDYKNRGIEVIDCY